MIDSVLFYLAWMLPRRLTYWCAVRVIAHASAVMTHVEMEALTPSDVLKSWDTPIPEDVDENVA